MSIAIITNLDDPHPSTMGLPRDVVVQLVERASQAGKAVSVCGCRRVSDVVESLRRAGRNGTEFVLIDPGSQPLAEHDVDALHRLGVPYIEVHADASANGTHLTRKPLSVVDGYGAQGYVLALSMALEYLGCAECENDIHVGT
jgi:3-dehydroquinate dehydratase-1